MHLNANVSVNGLKISIPEFSRTKSFVFSSCKYWMDDLRFYILFNSISVISGRWTDDNERLCTMESRLRLRALVSTIYITDAQSSEQIW